MKAGKELDALIIKNITHKNTANQFSDSYVEGVMEGFHPSTNIADAWLVVDKFKSEDYLFSLKNIVKGTFTFSLTDWGGNCSTYASEAETAPLAICLAALKAVGVE